MARAKRASIVFKVENVKNSLSLKKTIGWQNFPRKFWRGSLEKWKEKLPVKNSHDCSIVWALLKFFCMVTLFAFQTQKPNKVVRRSQRVVCWKKIKKRVRKACLKVKNTETCASKKLPTSSILLQANFLSLPFNLISIKWQLNTNKSRIHFLLKIEKNSWKKWRQNLWQFLILTIFIL